jgi:hypothetical protein
MSPSDSCKRSLLNQATYSTTASSPALFAGGTNGIVFAHGAHGNPHGGRVQQLVSHNGPVMTSGAEVKPIFWGSSWNANSGDKITGLDSFYNGVGGSAYAGTNTEYTDSSGYAVNDAVSYSGSVVDTAATPTGAPTTTQVLAVVARNVSNPVTNGNWNGSTIQQQVDGGNLVVH